MSAMSREQDVRPGMQARTPFRIDSGLSVQFELDESRLALTSIGRPGRPTASLPVPHAVGPVEIQFAGDAIPRGQRHIGLGSTRNLSYAGHETRTTEFGPELLIEQRIDDSAVRVVTHFQFFDDLPCLRTWSTVENAGSKTVTLLYISSLTTTALAAPGPSSLDALLGTPHNTFCAEYRWRFDTLRAHGLVDAGFDPALGLSSTSRVVVQNDGTQSTIEYLPMGSLRAEGTTWVWTIEHTGAWRWEIGDYRGGMYVSIGGPTAANGWRERLEPGGLFTTVPVMLAAGDADDASAFSSLSDLRRRLADEEPAGSVVIFNDFQRCLMADPSEDKLAPLVELAARAGAEVFCIDAGWYAEDGQWWETVGDWTESERRFPHGLARVMDEVRARGMIPGLWLEPEVVGVKNPVMHSLPSSAFFWREGELVDGGGRYILDFTSQAAVDHVDGVVDRLVRDYGIGYLKIDYNVNGGNGSDLGGGNPGSHLLRHQRAVLQWIREIRRRHPHLIVENCSSGGARADDASMRAFSIMSTSDQDDVLRTAPIAVNASTAAVPEKVGVWTLPDSTRPSNEVAFALVNSMLLRPQLSGPITELSSSDFELLAESVTTFKRIRERLRSGRPFWPLGLADWQDEWLALGMDCGERAFVAVWRRDSRSDSIAVPLSLAGRRITDIRRIFPRADPQAAHAWDSGSHALEVHFGSVNSAAVFEITTTVGVAPRR